MILREGQPACGGHHAGPAPGVLGRVLVVGADEHAGELRRGEPPGVQRDDQEYQVGRVEAAADLALPADVVAELDTIGG